MYDLVDLALVVAQIGADQLLACVAVYTVEVLCDFALLEVENTR